MEKVTNEQSQELLRDADPVQLSENAFRELADGEQYRPVMHPERNYPEVTPYSVSMGLILAVIFSAAAAYLGLRVGQVFEAAIPISIIAVGLSNALKKKNALGQNVIIQSIGSCSGVIVAGAIFTLPALYILKESHPEIAVDFMEVFLSSLLGGILGILFFIPFRKYFVKDMHGKYPEPTQFEVEFFNHKFSTSSLVSLQPFNVHFSLPMSAFALPMSTFSFSNSALNYV